MSNLQINYRAGSLRKLITLIVVFLNTGFALTLGYETQMIFINIIYILMDAIFHGGKIVALKNIRIWFVCVAFMMLTFFFHLDFGAVFEYGRVIIIICCAYYITTVFSYDELVVGFCKIMRVVAVVSCVFYFAVRFFPSLPYPTVTNDLGVEYYTCLLGNIRTDKAVVGIVRNCGLFWEGGMYAALNALWMICEIEYVKHERNLWLVISLGMLTIFTTNSTSGYLYIVLLTFLMVSHNSKGRRTIAQSMLLLIGLIVTVLAVSRFESLIDMLVLHNRSAFAKIVNRNASYTDRVNGPIADILTGIVNPVGIGLGILNEHVSQLAKEVFGVRLTTRTSTLTYFIAAHGPICGIFVNCQWFRVFKNTIDSKLERLIVIFTFIVLTTSTPLQYTIVFWVIIFLGDLSVRPKKKDPQNDYSVAGQADYPNGQNHLDPVQSLK